MVKVAITTKDVRKVGAVIQAFRNFFNDEDVSMDCFDIRSESSKNKVGQECFNELKNRFKDLRTELNERVLLYEYLVSCQEGLIRQSGHYYYVQIVGIESAFSGKRKFGMGKCFYVPSKYIDRVLESSIEETMERLLKEECKKIILSNEEEIKYSSVKEATTMALVGLAWI